MAGMSNGFKIEEDVKIKSELDTGSPGAFVDEDDDDTGELTVPRDASTGGWMTRVPQELWEGLNSLADGDEIQIGAIKVWSDSNRHPHKFRLELNRMLQRLDAKKFDLVPVEYDLAVRDAPKSAFVFSEKNLASFRPTMLGRSRVDRSKPGDRPASPYRIDKSKQRGPRIVPKHTTFLASPAHEVYCNPRETTEWQQIQEKKKQDLEFRKALEKRRADISASEIQKDSVATQAAFSKFVVADNKKKTRPQENKATRLPEKDLLDALAKCFSRYKFWGIEALRQETDQPEVWLREVLQKIAVRVTSGQAVNTWTLKADAANLINVDYSQIVKEEDLAKAKEEDIIREKSSLSDVDMDDFRDGDEDDMELEEVLIDNSGAK